MRVLAQRADRGRRRRRRRRRASRAERRRARSPHAARSAPALAFLNREPEQDPPRATRRRGRCPFRRGFFAVFSPRAATRRPKRRRRRRRRPPPPLRRARPAGAAARIERRRVTRACVTRNGATPRRALRAAEEPRELPLQARGGARPARRSSRRRRRRAPKIGRERARVRDGGGPADRSRSPADRFRQATDRESAAVFVVATDSRSDASGTRGARRSPRSLLAAGDDRDHGGPRICFEVSTRRRAHGNARGRGGDARGRRRAARRRWLKRKPTPNLSASSRSNASSPRPGEALRPPPFGSRRTRQRRREACQEPPIEGRPPPRPPSAGARRRRAVRRRRRSPPVAAPPRGRSRSPRRTTRSSMDVGCSAAVRFFSFAVRTGVSASLMTAPLARVQEGAFARRAATRASRDQHDAAGGVQAVPSAARTLQNARAQSHRRNGVFG